MYLVLWPRPTKIKPGKTYPISGHYQGTNFFCYIRMTKLPTDHQKVVVFEKTRVLIGDVEVDHSPSERSVWIDSYGYLHGCGRIEREWYYDPHKRVWSHIYSFMKYKVLRRPVPDIQYFA